MGWARTAGGLAFLLGVMAGPARGLTKEREGAQGFNDGTKVAPQAPSEAELMYEAMKRSGRGSKNDAAIDRAIARAERDSEKNRKALRMELAARSWRDPFVDDVGSEAAGRPQRAAGSEAELGAARAEAARARKETARARAEADAAKRDAARAKAEAARAEAVAQADAALARAEAARANADAARAEAKAALSDALAARASCGALTGPGEVRFRNAHRTTTLASARTTPAPKRIPTMGGRARLASATESPNTLPAEAPPAVVDEVPKAPPPSAPPGGSTGNPSSGFIVVPIPPAPPPAQGRTGRRP